ncbi:hypothetical protein NI17_007010 [Thermobifida halotolerans]|uniref:Uncharacterized protein n=1 Tax=Thermobifida halotolerans TaxID=483545 RepID=A0AA97LZP2_9ACTN|nr:hypothetical protein [Thermobifida halotolerans]UOE20916.1 hypothetical protein NI17_007010 [Thermobifida halotolerans]
MDLTERLLRWSLPRVFLVAAVGGTEARLAVERVLRERGWRRALTPIDADLLVVCGSGGPEAEEAVDRLWDQMPGPRARVRVVSAHEAARRLDRARAELHDVAAQRRDAASRPGPPEPRAPRGDEEQQGHGNHGTHGGHGTHDGHDDHGTHGGHGTHDGHDDHGTHGGHDDHGTHDGHGTHGGGMKMPGGLAMAQRGPDRDGLKLDRLHVALGPALPDWPSGLLVRTVLQGDVVQQAEVSTVGKPDGPPFWDAPVPDADGRPDWTRTRAAAAADSLQRLLAVAGWPDAAAAFRLLRDDLLAPGPWRPRARHIRWVRRVRRSRLLRWTTDGTGPAPAHFPEPLRGDATARWTRWLDDVAAVVLAAPSAREAARPPGRERAEHARAALAALPELLVGQELAGARLTVASLDPDLEALATHEPEAARG